MSGLEILGVAASAIQVAQVGLAIATSLTSIFLKIRDTPKAIQSQAQQVSSLVEVAKLISSKPQLQTNQVEVILQSCLKEARTLRDILQGLLTEKDSSQIKKWAKAIGGVVKESKIMELLQSLEREKSALVLCITSIYS